MHARRYVNFRCLISMLTVIGVASVVQAADPVVLKSERQRIAVIEKAAPAVVAIFARGGQGGGSGVLISADGYALSNYHVTSGSGNFMKCGLSDGVLYDAVIVGIDPTGDVALVKLLGRDDFPHAPLGDSDAVAAGDWCFAMGNPFLLATDFAPTVTYGTVSGMHRYQYPAGTILEYTDCIQVDASINPGNSGGPLFNAAGEVIGINGRGSFEKRGRVNSGAGYAISINQIKHFMDHLRSGRIVDHATLGATVTTRDDGAIVVDRILEESEAYRRGLRVDDEIVSFAGRTLRSVNQYKNVLGIYPKGWKLPLVFRRDDKKQEILVGLRGVHRKSEFLEQPKKQPQQPQPKPDDKPQPDGKKKAPRPTTPAAPPPAPVPEHLKKLFETKPGFANYYFNKVEQERALKGLKSLGDFSSLTGSWKLGGMTGDNRLFEFTVAEKGIGLIIGADKESFLQTLGPQADAEDEPQGTGGLLMAVQHFKLLLTKGPKAFSDFHYLGSEPLDGRGETVDVVMAELTGVQSHWFFSRERGTLVGFNLQRGDDVDPCEIRFLNFTDGAAGDLTGLNDGKSPTRMFPNRWLVRHAEKEFATFVLQKCSLATSQPAESK